MIKDLWPTHQEWHATVQGFCEVLCPWPPRHKTMSRQLQKQLQSEHHYYMWGRALAILAWLTVSCVIKEVFF